jgi:hypothetical protein
MRPVSSQIPNSPTATYARTSSVLRPWYANSQSWIDPAPLVATWVTQPSRTRRASSGPRPFRMR